MGLPPTSVLCAALVLASGPGANRPEGPIPLELRPPASPAKEEAWFNRASRLEAQIIFSALGTGFGASLMIIGWSRIDSSLKVAGGFLLTGTPILAAGVTGLAVSGSRLRAHRAVRPGWGRDTEWLEDRQTLRQNAAIFGAATIGASLAVVASSAAASADVAACEEQHPPSADLDDDYCYPGHAWGVAATWSIAMPLIGAGFITTTAIGIGSLAHNRKREFTPLRVQATPSGMAIRF